jgi:cellulose synthase/poly-beta-1,6-N-acetylglucosamine synthase-like glycosyltransferase
MTVFALVVIAASSVFLFLYGVNLLYLTARAAGLKRQSVPATLPPERTVVVQLPIYNERYVAERVIDACCRLDWPRDQFEVQVLDDSTDDTPDIVDRAVARWRAAGIAITHVRRDNREGYKAGALAHGLELTRAELVAVFDADFVPAPDFLRRMVPALADPKMAFVQARWGHLNEEFSVLTYLQSLMTDFHFLVEQAVRPRSGYLTNFAGSAGVWRRAAIEDAGGWSGSTLTEDLDLSYRAQLRGWRATFLEDVVVPQELPVSANAYRAQQSRWSTGSFQTASLLLGRLIFRSDLSPMAKFQATMHLLGYVAPIAMVAQILCYPALLIALAHGERNPLMTLPAVASVLSLAPVIGMSVAQWRRGREWWRHGYGLLGWSILGAGTSLTVVISIWRWLRGGGEFQRTPKYRIEHLGEEWRSKAYFKPNDVGAVAELVLGTAGLVLVVSAIRVGAPLLGMYAGLFAVGYIYLGSASMIQSLRYIRYENVTLRARAILPRLQAPGLLAVLAAVLLWVAHVLPDPFEDSYQHWLVAANLATTGRLVDPLFQMQDTWLPAYHVLAALVLKVFGTWSIGALKSMDVLLSVGTLAITFRLAGSRRRGLVAVALLALNPIFVLTSTEAVAEPLLVLLLMAALWAASAGRLGLAAVMACLACLTGTKAWLWLGCVVAVLAIEWLLRARVRSATMRRVAWVVPALALALTMQAVFGFASHSVARAAVEVGSATARGDLTTDPLLRGGSFLGYFALASLPIVILAPFGFLRTLRGRPLTLVALPSLFYLLLVTGLIVAGIYTGSHRYYYPALPGLALAAAAAVDRVRLPVALVPVGGAIVVAVAFIPVLNGLVADNRGLVAAGDSAAVLPGALITDSPAAAYFSHKPPSEIYGSRVLPSDRDGAVSWMRSRGVDGLVLENIDYYRAHAVLPDLMTGASSPPFVAVGSPTRYIVPGGKDVHVYELDRPVLVTRDGIGIATDQGAWPARTKTAPLAKGPVLMANGADVAGGGMGLGVPIAQFADGWWFPGPSSSLVMNPEGDGWTRTYDLNEHEVDDASGAFVRFEQAASHGQVRVTYRLKPGGLGVQVRVLRLSAGARQVVLLNEESSAFDDYADPAGTRLGDAIGSRTAVSGAYARFRSAALGVEWEVPAPPRPAGFFAERESRGGTIDFSGLEWEFGPNLSSVDYTISIRRAR